MKCHQASLKINLLGPFRVFVDGAIVEESRWIRRTPKLIIKLLALQPHQQLHQEQLSEMLWPDQAPEGAVQNLYRAVYVARRTLEPDLKSGGHSRFLITQDRQVSLQAPGELLIDVNVFERLAAEALAGAAVERYEKALSIYLGDLLIEDPYEDWAAVRREQLSALHRSLLTRLAGILEREGDYTQSIKRLKELIAIDPVDEEAHRQLMHLYSLTGKRFQALQQYRQCCDFLSKEIGQGPEAATKVLYRRIATGNACSLPTTSDSQRQITDSLAILPLANLNLGQESEYLCDGITENIINSLSTAPDLRVMAWSAVSRYKGREIDPLVIGRNLGVQSVMTGGIYRLEDRLAIATELVNVADGIQLWGEQYLLELDDLFDAQADIAGKISTMLRLRLSSRERQPTTRRYQISPETYQRYLRGRYFFNKRHATDLWRGIEYFERVINEAPDCPLGYVGMADCHAYLGGILLNGPVEDMPKAKAAALKALELDESLADAHASLGYIKWLLDWDWKGAEQEFTRAIELRPGDGAAHGWYACYLASLGRFDESIDLLNIALETDPLSLWLNTTLAYIFYLANQTDRAIERHLTTLELAPGYRWACVGLGFAYQQNGMYREALSAYTEAESPASIGHVLALSGEREKALKLIDELTVLSSTQPISAYTMAFIYLGLREKDQFFRWMDKAVDERMFWLVFIGVDPNFAPLRSDPRFTDLLTRIRLL